MREQIRRRRMPLPPRALLTGVGVIFVRGEAAAYLDVRTRVSLSLRGFGLHLEADPVGGVFLRQGRGQGDEVTE